MAFSLNTLDPSQSLSTVSGNGGAPGQMNSSLSPFTAGMTPDQVTALVQQYNQAAGLQNADPSIWNQYWTQFGAKDPGYFQTRLLNGINAAGGNMSPWQSLQSPTAGGGWGPGTAGYTSGSSGGPMQGGGTTGYSLGSSPLASLQNTPGYQFAQQAAMNAVQNSAAARGTLLTGGTLQALQGTAAGIAAGNTYFPTLAAYGNLASLGQTAAAGQ